MAGGNTGGHAHIVDDPVALEGCRGGAEFGDALGEIGVAPVGEPGGGAGDGKAVGAVEPIDPHQPCTANGTGTGKTFSGGGVIKRFVQQGKGNILVVAPSEAVIAGWSRAMDALGVPVSQLRDTKDAGQGVVITTYANLRDNNALASRSFDLIVTDESQNLMSSQSGDTTSALRNMRALAGRPSELRQKSRMIRADDWVKFDAMKDGPAKTATYTRLNDQEKQDVERFSKEPRAKALFLSATPFAYDKTVDYAEGFLFDYPKDGHVGNSRQSGQNLFMVQNFGYRIRYHKLTKPEAAVDSAVFEREFHEKLVRSGVLSGRSLQIDVDYDRKFSLVADGLGAEIDKVLKHIWDGGSHQDKAIADGYRTISHAINKRFNYLKRMQLLEAIKAKAAVDDIKKHLAMGRKVVVFHDYNVGGGFNPFAQIADMEDSNAIEAAADLMKAFPDLSKMDFSGYGAPVDTLLKAFPNTARAFNGTIPQKKRIKNLTDFNTDGSGADVLVVQADAGGAGISMHDVTGTHQRVLINLGMPTKPTTTLQEEGRILRVGTLTNAPFRYYTIGTGWERNAFAKRIAERSGTVENLALGNQARDLLTGFIDAYMEAETLEPSASDGTGGKERDRTSNVATPYDKAKTHYFGRTKTTGRRDQRDGLDFYPTPEPLAFKMIEWAGIRPNERVLEPSAGDGSIARYVPDYAALTMVEPSSDLRSTALLRAPHGKDVGSTFEDYHISNKHHVIVMNPPFGSGGKTAIDHLAKAARHLRPGGRIVALIPTGPSADKRFDAWWTSDDAKEFNWTADITMPSVAFEKAGTGVMTRVVILDRINDTGDRAMFGGNNGGTKRLNFSGAGSISDFFDRLEQYGVPDRPSPKQDVIEELESEGQDATTPPPSVKLAPPLAAQDSAFTLKETKHGKTGEPLFVATIVARVDRDTYSAILAVAKAQGGWYSAFKGNGAIPGFQFKTEAARAAFLEDMKKPTVGMAEDSGPALRTDTAAFRKWFGDSKVVDADGKPLVVYHGTAADFEAFDPESIGSNFGDDKIGFFFTNNPGPDMASGYATMEGARDGGNVVPAYLSLQKPYTLRDYLWAEGWSDQQLDDMTPLQLSREALDGRGVVAWWDRNKRSLLPVIEADGYDGVQIADYDMSINGQPEILLAAFDPTQIKSVFNHGEWSATDPRISYQVVTPQMVREAAVATEEILRVAPALRAELDRLDLGRVKLFVATNSPNYQGMFQVTGDGGMEITIAASMDPLKTLHHEVIHALRTMNLFTPAEWRALELSAVNGWVKKHDIVARYPDLLPSEQIEEAIAEEFSEALDAKRAPKGSALVTAFNKIARLFRAIRNAFHGAGFRTAEDIFGQILAGEISKRQAGNTGAITRLQAKKSDPSTDDMFGGQDQQKPTGMTAAMRREIEVRQQQSKMRKTGGNSGDAGPLFGSQNDLFGEGGPKFQRPHIVRPLTPQARAHRNSGMGGALFLPDRRVWEELTRAGAPIWSRLAAASGGARDAVDRARVQIQDRFLPILRAQEAVIRSTGQALPPEQNAYLTETTFSGKVGRHLFEIDEDFTKPIIDIIAETNGEMTADDVGVWLYARHAIERNAYIASINPAMPDGGSGMSDAEAQQVLGDVAASPHAGRFQQIGTLIDALRERTLKLREDKGLITHAEAGLWRAMYKHYVPLKGFAETDHSEAVLGTSGIGKRFNVRGQESRRALGRESEAFNPLQAAITQAQEASIRAEKNSVGQALYELAKSFPSKALWSVKSPKQVQFFNRSTGMVETRVEDPLSMILEPNEMAVKVSGIEHRIVFHDERIARAAGTVGADQLGWFVGMMSRLGRWFSSVNTMLDPEFVIRNAFRDMTAAQINIRNFGEADRNDIAKAMIRDWRKAFVAAYRGQGNKADTDWTKWYREYEQAGGKVSFWTMDQPEAAKGDLKRRIYLAQKGIGPRAAALMRLSTRDNPVLGFIERVNLSVDNAIRLAAYVAARKKGWHQQDAAALSKNLTVNFNRRGEYGATINALYVFANASVQGSQTLVRAMTSKRMAKYAIAMVALGMLLDQVNASLSREDDDGELAYDKIPDFKNRTNLTVMLGPESNTAATVWLPYGYSLFPYAGQQLSKVARGVKDPGEAMADFGAAMMQAFSPIGEGTLQQILTPTMLDPVNEMAMNADWLGHPIRPENAYADYGPDAYKFFKGASEGSKAVADVLNRATGGNEAEAGMIDVSPEYLDHAFGFVTGGAGRFVGRSVDVVAKAATGNFDDIESRDVPFVRSITYEAGEWLDRDRYYKFRQEVREANASAKIYISMNKRVPKDVLTIARLYESSKAAERAREKAKGNEKAEHSIFIAFNRQFLRVAGKQGE